QKSVTVHTDIAEGLPSFSGDPVRLRQVLFNLADNALKFTPEQGEMFLRAREREVLPDASGQGMVLMALPERVLELEVADTGIGIPAEDLERVFDAFFQVDSSSTREHGGAGLGLSIVRRLVDAHGGSVRVESTLGEGTSFFVTLPLDG
ncbi:MAG: ATP-binding protein, partial [Myxococcota bacterium]